MIWTGIRENTRLAMETLVAHKFRASLTILGVFIGVLVIVAMAAVLNGFRQSVLDQAESFGTRNVYLWRYPFIQTSRFACGDSESKAADAGRRARNRAETLRRSSTSTRG